MTPLWPDGKTDAGDDVDWPAMLRTALDGCGMRAVYQPIIDLTRGVAVGYEALIRFVGYPIRNPEPWFAAAREHGLSAPLQAAALRAALADRDTLPADCFLTVNIGPEVLHTREVRSVWQDHPDLRGIIVELTEHAAIDDHTALEPDLDRLRAAGARIAVDDAGSGPTGLTRLLTLRPAMIKLDRALISDIDRDDTKRALVEMIATFAARIDARLLAEGIERPGELATLAALDVPLGQGYHLGRPARPWTPITESAERTLLDHHAPTANTLRNHLEHPPVVTDPTLAGAAFTDPSVDLVVLCDENRRPVAALDDRATPIPLVHAGTKINVDTALTDAALRAITRTGEDRASPLLCTDNAGRYVGVVRIPRLMHALSNH
jgi:EAL domain-containing protein (putative c-di-GMP-specific phosphodiesterase class I)